MKELLIILGKALLKTLNKVVNPKKKKEKPPKEEKPTINAEPNADQKPKRQW